MITKVPLILYLSISWRSTYRDDAGMADYDGPGWSIARRPQQ